jgi:hypothetical protein
MKRLTTLTFVNALVLVSSVALTDSSAATPNDIPVSATSSMRTSLSASNSHYADGTSGAPGLASRNDLNSKMSGLYTEPLLGGPIDYQDRYLISTYSELANRTPELNAGYPSSSAPRLTRPNGWRKFTIACTTSKRTALDDKTCSRLTPRADNNVYRAPW